MSTVTQVTSTTNQQNTTYTTTKLLHGNNETIVGTLTASGDTAIVEGMVMGRVAATGLLTPCATDATDGSQYPVGLAIVTETILDGVSAEIVVVNKGYVNESLINFSGEFTLASTLGAANNLRTVRDCLADIGLTLKVFTQLAEADNA